MGFPADTDCKQTRLPDLVEEPFGLYPSLDAFSQEYHADDYREWVDRSNGDPLPAALTVYVQDSLCEESRLHSASAVQQELLLQGGLIAADRPMRQLLCAGNMLAAYSDDELYQLVENVQQAFTLVATEQLDWCASPGAALLSSARLRQLKVLGFNGIRFSLKGRYTPGYRLEDLLAAARTARSVGLGTVTLDVAEDASYPVDGARQFEELLDSVGRVRIMTAAGPERLRLIDCLYRHGFLALNAGWYVRADDSWLQAKAARRLYWSLVGFSEIHNADILGIGPGAVSVIGECYSANSAVRSCYQASIGAGELPIVSGLELEADDLLRREVIGMMLAAGVIQTASLENKWGIRFEQFFEHEFAQLCELESRGWVERRPDCIRITTEAHQELVQLCRLFDRRSRQR